MNATRLDIENGQVVALCGGVGGAKLALGLSRIVGAALTAIVNTGDDFEHLGLHISPDLDTVLYTLGGVANNSQGWGRADESWHFMDTLRHLDAETWFQLGDRDLALHITRTHALRCGQSLTEIMRSAASQYRIEAKILPMCDDPVRTMISTSQGVLPFQRYFVEHRCEPRIESITFEGTDTARASAQVTAALQAPTLRAVVLCPSNPFLSIAPILAVPGLRSLLELAHAPVVAVSPLIGGSAVKGPTAKIMGELGMPSTSEAIARHYGTLLDGIVIDTVDAEERNVIDIPVHVTQTLMKSDDDRDQLARTVLEFADRIAEEASPEGEWLP